MNDHKAKPAPTPWTYEEMTATIVIRAADGSTVCNLPKSVLLERRLANAKLICEAVNGSAKEEIK